MKRTDFQHIWIALFGINIYWVRCSHSKYEELVKAEFAAKAPDMEESVAARFEVYKKPLYEFPIGVIWLSREAELSSAAHECFHAAHWICEKKGIWLTDSSEEIYAYLVEYLLSSIEGLI
jgi:hypothetical protein